MAEIENRAAFELQFGDCLRRAFGGREEELARELGDPPSPFNVDQNFWNRFADDLSLCLEEILVAIFVASATQHLVDNIVFTVNRRNAERQARLFVDGWIARRNLELTQQLLANSQRMLFRKNANWIRRLEAGLPVTAEHVKQATRQIFGDRRIELIVTTETTRSIESAGEQVMNQFGLTHPNDIWVNHPELSATGPCRICRPLHRTARAVWSRKYPAGPPVHGYCVCEVVYWWSNRRAETLQQPPLDSVFIGTPGGDLVAPTDRGTRPEQIGV